MRLRPHLLLARQVGSHVAEPLLQPAHGVGASGGAGRVAAASQQLRQVRRHVPPSNVQAPREVREGIALASGGMDLKCMVLPVSRVLCGNLCTLAQPAG